MQRWKENQPAVAVTQLNILNLRYYTPSGTVRGGTLLIRGVFQHFEILSGPIRLTGVSIMFLAILCFTFQISQPVV